MSIIKKITFFDTEINPNSEKILDIGAIKLDNTYFHSANIYEFECFLKGSDYICGHNILKHDLKYVGSAVEQADVDRTGWIDTLYISPLLFPKKPYHSLLKDDKLQTEELNNPLNDSIKTKELFFHEINAFISLDDSLKRIFFNLLKEQVEFLGFFNYLEYYTISHDLVTEIRDKFNGKICDRCNLKDIVYRLPIELAYCLALINTENKYSITPPWVLVNYPEVERVMMLLRNNHCIEGCCYCDEFLNPKQGLKQFFGFDSFKSYAGEPLQEKAVKAAILNKSLLAVFPTGGGKSITFQVPALMSGVTTKGLTIIISPLQSLMKDQVDNLEKLNIIDAVTINGLLDPIERAKAFERIESGSASILYISPESLRSKSIEKLLLGRNVVRVVIDEAHCFSVWGQDFRVDYMYIGDFIKEFQKKKNSNIRIPVSCFTATAKKKVIEDIQNYFKEKLDLDLELFTSKATRTNLKYKVIQTSNDDEKYNKLRFLLGEKTCPTIVYVSRTKRAYEVAKRLNADGYIARPYHGKMDKREKSDNQDAFIKGDVQIMVATSAFGMGVDKKDVGVVIHYEISDSLENYVQEAGRAGRDENIVADCYVLFNDEDLNKHFIMLNQTKLSIQEIQQIWKAIKETTKFRNNISYSALEIAKKAGWDEGVFQLETRVKSAIYALEDAGYIKRGQNMPKVYADGILCRNSKEAIERINNSKLFNEQQKIQAIRIIKKLISSKSKHSINDEVAEARVDYISDHLGISKEDVIKNINLMREERILADSKDLKAFIRKKTTGSRALSTLKSFLEIEKFLLLFIDKEERVLNLKEINGNAEEQGIKDCNSNKIRMILNYLAIKNFIKRSNSQLSKDYIKVNLNEDKEKLLADIQRRHELSEFILRYLAECSCGANIEDNREEIMVEFSVLQLVNEYNESKTLFGSSTTTLQVEDSIFYLSKVEILKIEGGFLVTYNGLNIQRIEKDNKIRYKLDDYQKLEQFYTNKIQQIHIVGEYAKQMIEDYKHALQFVDDYFQLNYNEFLLRYFKGSKVEDIKRNITPSKFKQIFGELSTTQLKIINDKESKNIVVAAGPGSGKTRILVHKLAALVLMEDVKYEQMLMLTFSRAATTEFKKRLLKLIGNAAQYISIKTFHSYCFDLIGRIGSLEKSGGILDDALKKLKNAEIEASNYTKTVLVLDEAQDMDEKEFQLVKTLMDLNEDIRVIAVGDDDQNIFEFRGANSKYIKILIKEYGAKQYELIENYRSKENLIHFTNQYVKRIPDRLKSMEIRAVQKGEGLIKIVKYKSANLVMPLIDNILLEKISGSTCVLTKSNEEALQITSLLLKSGVNAKLIQSNDGFNLYNLIEIRSFINLLNNGFDNDKERYIYNEENWNNAKKKLVNTYKNSINLEASINMINDFEKINPKNKYKTDFECFVRETKLEDLYSENNETIYVSTIHKAKGREFENVFLILDNFVLNSIEANRQIYVAMTRAKEKLIIHYNDTYLDGLITNNIERIVDNSIYYPPSELVMQLSFKDVWLDFFLSCQELLKNQVCGDELYVKGDYCINNDGKKVAAFSKQFRNRVKEYKEKGYVPKSAKIRFIIYWKKENEDCENLILLPEIVFEKEEKN